MGAGAFHGQGSQHSEGARGFTLVELLVALFALSILAALSWRGLDSMVRTQTRLQARADQVLALQAGLAQWAADLDALEPLPNVMPLDWNGRVLRLVRRSAALGPDGADGVVVAAWAQQTIEGRGNWMRWQSPPLVWRAQVEQAWRQAEAWGRNAADAEPAGQVQVQVLPIEGWEVFYFLDNAWRAASLPDSSATPNEPDSPRPTTTVPRVPQGIRLVLTLPAGEPASGTLTLDWVSARAGARAS